MGLCIGRMVVWDERTGFIAISLTNNSLETGSRPVLFDPWNLLVLIKVLPKESLNYVYFGLHVLWFENISNQNYCKLQRVSVIKNASYVLKCIHCTAENLDFWGEVSFIEKEL